MMQKTSKPILYRGWQICYDLAPIRSFDWTYSHLEYDGPEDRRIGTAATLKEAIEAIDDIVGEDGFYPHNFIIT